MTWTKTLTNGRNRARFAPHLAALAGFAMAFGSPPASSPEADVRARAAAEIAERTERQAELKETWQRRYDEALGRVASANARIEKSERTIRKLRQRDRYKGPERAEVDSEMASAQSDLEDARREVAEFPDVARQAGIPPGWLREVEERRAREG